MHGVWCKLLFKEAKLLVLVHDLFNDLDVSCGDHCLLFARVRDLWDRRDRPIVWLARPLHTTVVAISDRINATEAFVVGGPDLALTSLHCESLIHQDPTTTSRPFLTQCL